MNRAGQVMAEFIIGTLLIATPLAAGCVYWVKHEWSATKCAYETFFSARRQLIQTNRPVSLQRQCGTSVQNIALLPLEDFDSVKGALRPSDGATEVSQWSESASHLLSQLSALGSSN